MRIYVHNNILIVNTLFYVIARQMEEQSLL